MTVRAPHDRRLVQPALFTLMRAVAGRMAVDAARMGQHFAESVNKAADRALVSPIAAKLSGPQAHAARSRGRVTGQHAHRERGGSNET